MKTKTKDLFRLTAWIGVFIALTFAVAYVGKHVAWVAS